MTGAAPDEAWSDDLEAQTRAALEGNGLSALLDGQLCFKHVTSKFGIIAADDLRHGVLRLVDRRGGEAVTFRDVDALIAAGWVID